MLNLPVIEAFLEDVGVEPSLAVLGHDGAALPAHVREVVVEHQVAVALVELEPEEAALGARGTAPRHGGVAGRRHGGGRPPDRGAPEGVGDLLALGHAEHELVLVGGGGVPAAAAAGLGPEVAHVARARRGQVGLDLVEGLAALDAPALVLLEGHRQVRVDHRGEPPRATVEVAREELLQVDVLQVLPYHGPAHGQNAYHHRCLAKPRKHHIHLSTLCAAQAQFQVSCRLATVSSVFLLPPPQGGSEVCGGRGRSVATGLRLRTLLLDPWGEGEGKKRTPATGMSSKKKKSMNCSATRVDKAVGPWL